MANNDFSQWPCSVARSLGVVGEKWTLLVLREAVDGTTKFSDFRAALGMTPDVLTTRLATLVDAGVMTREAYREEGSRERHAYHLTEAGRELHVVLGALQQWGDKHRPWEQGNTVERRDSRTDGHVHVAFVDEHGREVPDSAVVVLRTDSHPFGPSA
ncbi:winged helix-turn-helix transcriptional regulator [Williamsia sp. M5A3_1d]